MLGQVRNRTDTGDTVKRTMGGDEEALQTAMPRDTAPLYAVEGCSAENLRFAGTLFEKWLKYDVTTPKDSSYSAAQGDEECKCAAYFAAMLYLVERAPYHKLLAGTRDTDVCVGGGWDAAGEKGGGDAVMKPSCDGSETVTIRSIIAGTATTVFHFFKATTKVLELASRQEWLTELLPNLSGFVDEFKQVEVKFMFAYMLHEKLKKTYREICLDAQDESGTQRRHTDSELHLKIPKLVWTLFVAVRVEERLTDLVPGFFLLLASMHTVLSGRPAAFQDALVFPEARDAPVKVVKKAQCSLLEKICDAYCGTQMDKLQAARRNVQKLLSALKAQGAAATEAATEELPNADATDASAIARDETLDSWITALKKFVQSRRASLLLSGDNVEVDGLIFLEAPHLVGSPHDAMNKRGSPTAAPSAPSTPCRPSRVADVCSLRDVSSVASSPAGAWRMHHTATSPFRGSSLGPPRTPDRGVWHQQGEGRSVALRQGVTTPMHGVMRDVNWLSLYVSDEDVGLDPILRAYCAACDTDLTESLVARLEHLPRELTDVMDSELVAVAVKVYLKSLRFVLQKEEERLKRNNFTNILQDDAVQRALLAISFEIVLHTHMRHAHALAFPRIPLAFKVCALEFYIMTDNFMRYFETVLPAEMRRHLNLNRQRILDYNIWKKDSTLLAHLLSTTDRDLSGHFCRAIEACHKGGLSKGALSVPPQASPMIVRPCRPPVYPNSTATAGSVGGCASSSSLTLASALASAASGPLPSAASPSADLPASVSGLAAMMAAGHVQHVAQLAHTSPVVLDVSLDSKRSEKSEKSEKSVKSENTQAQSDPQAGTAAADARCGGMSAPAAGDKSAACKTHIQKQLVAVARGLWQRVSTVVTELCRALQVSEKSLRRSLNVANHILCNAKARELLYDRHLHQVLMCVVFAACRLEDADKVLFRKIIDEHHALYPHTQLGAQIYWLLEMGPAGDRDERAGPAQNLTGNLIEFYNKKFIPVCKDMVLEDYKELKDVAMPVTSAAPTHNAAHSGAQANKPPAAAGARSPARVRCSGLPLPAQERAPVSPNKHLHLNRPPLSPHVERHAERACMQTHVACMQPPASPVRQLLQPPPSPARQRALVSGGPMRLFSSVAMSPPSSPMTSLTFGQAGAGKITISPMPTGARGGRQPSMTPNTHLLYAFENPLASFAHNPLAAALTSISGGSARSTCTQGGRKRSHSETESTADSHSDDTPTHEDDTPTTTKRACGKHLDKNNASQMMEVGMRNEAAAALAILSSMKSAGSEQTPHMPSASGEVLKTESSGGGCHALREGGLVLSRTFSTRRKMEEEAERA